MIPRYMTIDLVPCRSKDWRKPSKTTQEERHGMDMSNAWDGGRLYSHLLLIGATRYFRNTRSLRKSYGTRASCLNKVSDRALF
jgi:hypothetical protein